jgi:hypothetical protein
MATEFAFLLGAGASKALGMHVKPCTPPLMSELYVELAKAFPKEWGAGSPLERYGDQFRKDFEQTFTEVVLKTTNDYALPGPALSLLEGLRPLALYFSRFVLDRNRMDYYSKLLDALGRSGNIPHTVFGSLNYDCLFEQAARILDLCIDYEWGNAVNSVRVAKLHGSSNFIAQIDQRERAILAGTTVQVEVPVIILPVENLEKELGEKLSGGRTAYLPIMSQVSHYKEQLLAPAAIQRMRNGWNAGVHDAKVIAIIGVSFNCYDRHIIEQIENASGTVLYIGDEASFKMWRAANRSAQRVGRRLEDGFHALLTHLGI